MMDFISEVESDSTFTAKRRHLQSEYREKELKEESGFGPTADSKTHYGNYLVNGENTGKNFVSDCAFQYAKQRVRDKAICPELTIDEYRLFNNMLSSMPLCFNLFSDLRDLLLESPDECTKVVKTLFTKPNWIGSVEYIGVEFIPTPIKDYTDDKSAFDAIIIVKDQSGKRGVVSVETKYTDLLGTNTSSKTDTKDIIIQEDKLFCEDLTKHLTQNGYKQIYRNFLLTYAYAKKNKMPHFANVIISPREDTKSKIECEELEDGLRKIKDVVFKIDLEDFIERGIGAGSKRIAEVFRKIKARYLPD
jgi:hypothetical protein